MRHLLSLIAISLIVISCQKDLESNIPTEETPAGYDFVDKRLWPYFRTFEEEAVVRNVSVDLKSMEISGVIEEISEENIVGTCQYGRSIPGHVTIDATFWNKASMINRELVVFHELGHCALFRDHDDGADQFGRCLSIMGSGTGNCRSGYNNNTRSKYLEELFSKVGGL